MKRFEMFEKYKEEHPEFKDAKFGNIKKETGCDELLVIPTEDGYAFLYILSNVITAKVFYNKKFEIHNEKGPAAIETSFVVGCKGKISVFPNKERFSFYKNGKFFGNAYENKEYTTKIWNESFISVVGRLRNISTLTQCLDVAKKFEKEDIVDRIKVRLVALNLTKT